MYIKKNGGCEIIRNMKFGFTFIFIDLNWMNRIFGWALFFNETYIKNFSTFLVSVENYHRVFVQQFNFNSW